MVPAGWNQLPRDGRMPRVSAIKIWRKNNFTPDSSPLVSYSLDFPIGHVIRCEPSTIAEFKTVVEDLAVNMSGEEGRKMVRNTKKRAELCRDKHGGHFERLLKKHKCPSISYPLILLFY